MATATWLGLTAAYNTATNWSTGLVPNGVADVAVFSGTTVNNSFAVSQRVDIGTFLYIAGSTTYQAIIQADMGFYATGIENNSGVSQYINIQDQNSLQFHNSSDVVDTGGSRTVISAIGDLQIYESANASDARFVGFGGRLILQTGSGLVNVGSIEGSGQIIGGTNIGSSNIQTLVVGSLNSNTTYRGDLIEISASLAIRKVGTGSLTFTGPGNYSGTTEVSAGVLSVQNGTALGSVAGGTTVADGATLQIQGGIAIGAEALTLSGGGSNGLGTAAGNGALESVTGANSFGGAISLAAASRINVDAGSLALSGGVSGTGQNLFLGAVAGATGTVSGIINTVTGTLTKDGAGTWVLSGANIYTGATTVSGGTFALAGTGSVANSSNVLNSSAFDISGLTSTGTTVRTYSGAGQTLLGAKNLTVQNGGTVDGVISGTGGSLTITGGTLTLTNANTYTGGTTVSAGTLQLNHVTGTTIDAAGSGAITIGAGTLEVAQSGTLANTVTFRTNSNATLAAKTGTTVTLTGDANFGDGFPPGLITFGSAGDQGTIVLNSSNNSSIYVGIDVEVAGGVLKGGAIGTLNALINTSGYLKVDAGATIDFNGVTSRPISISNLQGDSATTGGTVTNTVNTTIRGGNFAGELAGSGGYTFTTGFTTSTTILSGSNTYTGATIIAAGATLQLGAGGASGTINTASAITNNGTLAFNHGDSLTFGNSITGSGGLTHTGIGTLTLTGTDGYTGTTTVSGGTLLVNGSLGNTAVMVGVGATVGGTGTIAGPVTVSGTISAGPAFSVGTLATGSLILSTAGGATPVFHEDIASRTSLDHINVTGTVALAGTLDLLLPVNLSSSGESFVFINNDGTADAVTGAFTSLRVNGVGATLAGNNTFQLQSYTYQIDYRAGDGNDVALRDVTFVPQQPTATTQTNGTGGNDIVTSDPSTVTTAVGTNAIDTVYYSGSQPLTLPGNIENVVLSGQGGNAAITGNGGNNAFVVKSGSWHIEGGGGSDVLVFATELSGHTIQLIDANNYVVTGQEGTEQVSNVAGIGFAHDQITFDFSTNAAEVVRLYDATLHRAADIGGGTNALAQLNGGVTLAQLSQAFLNSSEGQLQYAPAQTNTQFVDALYANVLHRAQDAGGEANWVAALNAGTSRGAVLAAFSEAPEHAAYVQFNQVVGIAVDHPIIG